MITKEQINRIMREFEKTVMNYDVYTNRVHLIELTWQKAQDEILDEIRKDTLMNMNADDWLRFLRSSLPDEISDHKYLVPFLLRMEELRNRKVKE